MGREELLDKYRIVFDCRASSKEEARELFENVLLAEGVDGSMFDIKEVEEENE